MKQYLALILLICCASLSIQAQTGWSRIVDFCPDTFRSSNNITHVADDSFFMAAGHTSTAGVSPYHCYLSRIDYQGNVQQTRSLYSPGKYNRMMDYLGLNHSMIKTGHNKYVLVGVEDDTAINAKITVSHPFFYFFDNNCDSLLLAKHLDTLVSYRPFCVMQDAQKNLIVTGDVSSTTLKFNTWSNTYYYDSTYTWIAKYDSNAKLIWSRKYYGYPIASGTAWTIISGHDGQSYLFAGDRYNTAKFWHEAYITKIDTAGNILWSKFLKRPFKSRDNMDIVPLKNGHYGFVSGYSDTLPYQPGNIPHESYIYYGQFDENGDTLWTRHFRKIYGNNVGKNLTESEDGGLIIYADVTYESRVHSTVIRTKPNGDIQWYREYRHVDTPTYIVHETSSMSLTPNKQVLLTGNFRCVQQLPGIFDTVGRWSWFVLTDTLGCIDPGCEAGDTIWNTVTVKEAGSMSNIKVYPNPAADILYITIEQSSANVEASLTDVQGRILVSQKLVGGRQNSISISSLPPGIYLLELKESGRRLKTVKIVHY